MGYYVIFAVHKTPYTRSTNNTLQTTADPILYIKFIDNMYRRNEYTRLNPIKLRVSRLADDEMLSINAQRNQIQT